MYIVIYIGSLQSKDDTLIPVYMTWCEHRLRLSSVRVLESLICHDHFIKLLIPNEQLNSDIKNNEMKDILIDILR